MTTNILNLVIGIASNSNAFAIAASTQGNPCSCPPLSTPKAQSIVNNLFSSDKHRELNDKAVDLQAKAPKLNDEARKTEFKDFETFMSATSGIGDSKERCFSKAVKNNDPGNYCQNNAIGNARFAGDKINTFLDQITKGYKGIDKPAMVEAKLNWCAVVAEFPSLSAVDTKSCLMNIVADFCRHPDNFGTNACSELTKPTFDWTQFDAYTCD